MRAFWTQPLRRQLLLANLLLLVPVLGLSVWSAVSTLFDRRDEVVSQARVVATTTASYIDRDLRYIDSMGQLLTAEPAVQALDGARASATVEQVILGRPSIMGVVITTQGQEIGRAVRDDVQLPALPWVMDLAEPARHVLSTGGSDAGTQHLVYSYPITGADMKARGTLAVFVDTKRLRDALEALPLPQGSVVQIIDEQGRVIGQNVPNSSTAGGRLLQMDPDRTVSSSEALVFEGADKVVRLQVETRATQGPWQIMIGVPRSEAFNRALPVWRRSMIVLAIGLFGGCLAAWFLARRLGRSLTHLDKAARRIADGDFSPIQQQPMHSAEFADLQRTFGRMLGQFNSTRSVLDAQMGEERRIRQELESLQGQVIRQERLAAVGQLVSGVAHEINNPLQAILGFAELLQMQQDVPDSVKGDLKVIQKESARACAIIRNLAMFARQQPGIAGPVLMTDVIRSVVELRHRRLQSEDIELHVQDGASRPVKAILTELQQVVLNFVVNAEQAIIASGRLPGRITIRTLEQDERVVLEVEDTGPGIPPEDEAKLFQPFFTTKPVGQGTGLGLSISYGIVESLGGGIGYRSAPAGGAIFYFDLPATTDTRPLRGD